MENNLHYNVKNFKFSALRIRYATVQEENNNVYFEL